VRKLFSNGRILVPRLAGRRCILADCHFLLAADGETAKVIIQVLRKLPTTCGAEKTNMPNIVSVLRSEISRIARREVRAETEGLKRQSAQYRSHIAALRRQVADLEKLLRKQSKGAGATPTVATNEVTARTGLRFRPKGFATHRKRLGLSAAHAGALLGVSGQTVYHWETGKAKPRASQLTRIDAFRKLSKKGAGAAVAQVIG